MALTKINNNTLSAITGLPAGVGGKVLQVVSTTKTDTTTVNINATTFVDIGLSVNITPSSSSSKIFVKASVTYSINNNTYGTLGGIRLARGSTGIGIGGNDGSSYTVVGDGSTATWLAVTAPLQFLDSPSSTSELTYKVQAKQNIGGTETFVSNGKKNSEASGSSTITVMEIAG